MTTGVSPSRPAVCLPNPFPPIEIVSVRDIIEDDKRITIPLGLQVLKSAKAVADAAQPALFGEEE